MTTAEAFEQAKKYEVEGYWTDDRGCGGLKFGIYKPGVEGSEIDVPEQVWYFMRAFVWGYGNLSRMTRREQDVAT